MLFGFFVPENPIVDTKIIYVWSVVPEKNEHVWFVGHLERHLEYLESARVCKVTPSFFLKQVIFWRDWHPWHICIIAQPTGQGFWTLTAGLDLKFALLLPSMNEKTRRIITRLNATQREDYEEVKKQVLWEFKMTPRAYRMQFMESTKEATEYWMQYASRLETILSYYMEGRSVVNIEKNDPVNCVR